MQFAHNLTTFHVRVKKVWSLLQERRLWPVWVSVLAFVVLVPRYWSHGYWEPYEIQIADKVRKRLESADKPDDQPTRRGRTQKDIVGPPLTEWSIAQGIQLLDDTPLGRQFGHEFGARFPLVVFGLIVIIGTFFIGRRLGGHRAGLLSALIVLTFPLVLFQARHLNSSLGAAAGNTLLVLGLVGLCWPAREQRKLWMYPADVVLVVIGSVLGYYGGALVLGVIVPFVAVAIACILSLGALRSRDGKIGRWNLGHLGGGAVIASLISLVLLGVLFFAFFDIRDGYPTERGLFGKTLAASSDYTNIIGGTWRDNADLNATFDVMFEQLAFGMFPWIALAPIALASFATAPGGSRRVWGGYIMFLWALLSWAVATVYLRKVGPVHFPAVTAIAVGVGLWLDRLLERRAAAAGGGSDPPDARTRLPLVALFVLLCVLVLAKDLQPFAEKIAGVHILGTKLKFPPGTSIKAGLLVFGVLFALPLAASLWGWGWSSRRLWPKQPPLPAEKAPKSGSGKQTVPSAFATVRRTMIAFALRGLRWVVRRGDIVTTRGVHVALGVGVVYALFLTQCWTPTLSEKFSSKKLYQYYKDHKRSGDEIGLMGAQGSPPKYYLREEYTKLRNRADLLKFLRQSNRVFAVTPRRELCPVHRAAKDGIEYHLLYDRHTRLLLMSNKMGPGETDLNPLNDVILHKAPSGIKTRFATPINFNNQIELLGVSMPASVRAGSQFDVTLYYRVKRKVSGNWKVFLHFDPPASTRFNGDHTPIRGLCPTGYWDVGDYIVDTHTIEAGGAGFPKTVYRVYTGFFQGRHGNWRNMKVIPKTVNGKRVVDERVPIGVIRLK